MGVFYHFAQKTVSTVKFLYYTKFSYKYEFDMGNQKQGLVFQATCSSRTPACKANIYIFYHSVRMMQNVIFVNITLLSFPIYYIGDYKYKCLVAGTVCACVRE